MGQGEMGNPNNMVMTQSQILNLVTDLSSKMNIPAGTILQYIDGTGALQNFPLAMNTTIQAGTITRAAATASGTQVITTTFLPSFILFSAIDDLDNLTLSDGWDDGTNAVSTRSYDLTVALSVVSANTKSHTQSIYILGILGNGHSANVSAKSSTSFTLNWTKIASGRAVTVKYLAVQ